MFNLTRKAVSDRSVNTATLSDRLGLNTVPAAWPTGVSQLAIAVDACQRRENSDVCGDLLARASK
jgi:hypothetical protein